jgi:hypothetical protein
MINDREEEKIEQKKKDKEMFEQNKKELNLAILKDEEKQKQKQAKLVNNYEIIKNQIDQKEATRPLHMDSKEEAVNRDLLGELKKRNII